MKTIALFITLVLSLKHDTGYYIQQTQTKNVSLNCNGFMNVKREHGASYYCPRCQGSGNEYVPGCKGECEHKITCRVCGGGKSFRPKTPTVIEKYLNNFTPGYYLFLTRAYIRDDGENARLEPGDIGLVVKGGGKYQMTYYSGRLFGPVNNGFDSDYSLKYEWLDYCEMQYDNFPLMKLNNYPYQNVYIQATEGDEIGSDDVVFAGYVNVSNYRTASSEMFSITGNCEKANQCATFWLSIKYCDSNECGDFWQD
jgi:hypothetical protein